MKKSRVIFTIYISPEEINKHFNTGELKMGNLDLFAEALQVKQNDWAMSCGAEYRVYKFGQKFIDFTVKLWEKNIFEEYYQAIQHYKIFILEELTKEYDEVLYVDLDVWPHKFTNIFEEIDVNKGIAVRGFSDDKQKDVKALEEGWLTYVPIPRSVSTKTALMKALCSKGEVDCPSDVVFNTAITLANERYMQRLNYFEEIENTRDMINELKEHDPFYADYIHCMYRFNNESVFSYLLFKNKVPWQSLDEKWHWVSNHRNPEEACPDETNLVHVINKKFRNVTGLASKEY